MDAHRRAGPIAAADEEPSRFRAEPGTLYVVATPVGNLRDVTLRALDILGTADVIAAEDTRVTATLLRHFGIAARPLALHEHNETARAVQIVAALRDARSVALVSDAGTPAVSDPGARLVRAVHDAGLPVVPIPGANAAIAAVSAAGLVASHFLFLGFLPAMAKARRDLLHTLAPLPCALVIYEAPHRVEATIAALNDVLGGMRELTVARELTKKFETIARMPLAVASAWLAEDANRQRGEFVLLVDAPAARTRDATDAMRSSPDADRWLRALVAELPPARAARVVAAVTGVPRDHLYARALALKADAG
jgi:16S rRNA (cytidine1402-2'-O)-methyltransferase